MKIKEGAEWMESKKKEKATKKKKVTKKVTKPQPPEKSWKWIQVEAAEMPTLRYKEVEGHLLDSRTEYSGELQTIWLSTDFYWFCRGV